MVIGIICWIVLGLMAGFIVTRIVRLRNDDPKAYLLVGVVGAAISGWLFNTFSAAGATGFNLWSLLAAAAGAVVLLGAAAVLVVPVVGPMLAMGVLASALGFGAAGVATGGILGAMVGLGISENEARVYEKEFHAGRAIVTVHAGERVAEARRILDLHGARNVHSEPTDPLHPVSMALAPRYTQI